MAMASASQPDVGLAEARKAAAPLVASSSPAMSLHIEGRTVIVADVASDIQAFQEQQRILAARSIREPCAVVNLHTPDGDSLEKVAILIDLSAYGDIHHSHIGHLVDTATTEVRSAGFKVVLSSIEDAKHHFIDGIARLISLRWKYAKRDEDIDHEPPTEEVEVHTRINQVDVLWADGHFLNTKERFGRATPATGTLPYGNYTFGVRHNGEVRFDELLTPVPTKDRKPIYLDLP